MSAKAKWNEEPHSPGIYTRHNLAVIGDSIWYSSAHKSVESDGEKISWYKYLEDIDQYPMYGVVNSKVPVYMSLDMVSHMVSFLTGQLDDKFSTRPRMNVFKDAKWLVEENTDPPFDQGGA